jgi:Flp pilus assembly pilin Flp
MQKSLLKFLREERGVSAAEFGLWLPLIVLIIFGCFEATRFVIIHQKLDRAATQVADLVGQSEMLSTAELANIYNAAIEQLKPFDLAGQGEVVVSSIYRDPSEADGRVQWQRNYGSVVGGGSKIGTEGAVATLPANFSMVPAENTITAEVLYRYEPVFFGALASMKNLDGSPLFGNMFQEETFYHSAWSRPRGANLVAPPS